MRRVILAALAASFLAGPALAQTVIERDVHGRRIGTIERRGDGSAVHRDATGRRTGTYERRGDKIIERDATGRRTGMIELPRGGRRE